MASSLYLNCLGIVDPGGVTLTHSDGWSLSILMRATFDDPDNGDMTGVDFPLQIPLPHAGNGRLNGKFTPPELLLDLDFAFGCAQLEILRVSLKDPTGAVFATLGAGKRPKGF